jgi:hypothetical protein
MGIPQIFSNRSCDGTEEPSHSVWRKRIVAESLDKLIADL